MIKLEEETSMIHPTTTVVRSVTSTKNQLLTGLLFSALLVIESYITFSNWNIPCDKPLQYVVLKNKILRNKTVYAMFNRDIGIVIDRLYSILALCPCVRAKKP